MFNIGDEVVYKSAFLRSVQWVTDVPQSGLVVELPEQMPNHVRVKWCNYFDDPVLVAAGNLILKSRMHLEPA